MQDDFATATSILVLLNSSMKFTDIFESLILQAHQGPWTETLTEATVSTSIKFQACDLFNRTFAEKTKNYPGLSDKFKEFTQAKTANPGQPFGGSDTPFINAGPLARAIPKLRHAHLTRDLSVFYTIEGKNPTVVQLYGIFSHQESGTGTPGNINKQKNLAKQLTRC